MILSRLPAPTPGANELPDVGCAHGFLLDEARRLGWNVHRTETAQAFAIQRLGLGVVRDDLLDTTFSDASFDVITIIGSIEHLPDPVGHVAKMAALLKPGGGSS